ncbi:MAG: DUF502 domain-containing protein [Hyphomicrobiaceae bacterium]|nr:DUF502 domain-containing protein [Hyphomicrobiaceae bacterium]
MGSNSRQTPDAGHQGARPKTEAELRDRLKSLVEDDDHGWHLGARLRNYFLTGLIIVGPVTLTVYIIWWLVNVADAWFKPFVPKQYLPDTYLPFAVPGVGLIVGIGGLTLIGALTANLLGRTLISYGELMLGRMPIVRNVYRALKQIFESVVSATDPNQSFQKVGIIEFPSKGLWSIVFVTGETGGEIMAARPGGNEELYTVFMPTGIVPPTGFICFVPRDAVQFVNMSIEDAAKIIISGGMVTPTPGLIQPGEARFTYEAAATRPAPAVAPPGVAAAAPPQIADAIRRASKPKPRSRR